MAAGQNYFDLLPYILHTTCCICEDVDLSTITLSLCLSSCGRVSRGGGHTMKDWAKSFYQSKQWYRCRASYIAMRMATDGGLCEVCGKEQGYIVHHIRPLTEQNIGDPNISLNHDNLRFECKQCHDEEEGHYYDAKGVKRLICLFDENGQPAVDLRRI